MPEKEKKTGAEKKKRSKKSRKSSAKEQEPPAPRQLDREQLEALREKLQRKYH